MVRWFAAIVDYVVVSPCEIFSKKGDFILPIREILITFVTYIDGRKMGAPKSSASKSVLKPCLIGDNAL